MNTSNITDSLSSTNVRGILNAEQSCPAYGAGKLSAADDRFWSMASHLIALIVLILKRGQSPALDAHWKMALNFQLTMFIAGFVLGFLGALPVVGVVFMLASVVLSLVSLALAINGLLKAKDGKLFRYPLSLHLIK